MPQRESIKAKPHMTGKPIALFLPSWIGDVVMATPAIRSVQLSFPDSKIFAIATKYVADVVSGSPRFDRVILYDKKKPYDVIRELNREKVASAVLLTNSFRAALIARLGGCVKTVGYRRYLRDILLSYCLSPKRGKNGSFQPTPIIDDYNNLAVRFGAELNQPHEMELFTTACDEAAGNEAWARLGLGRYRHIVGLNSGGAFGAAKHWPAEFFAVLAKKIAIERGAGVLMLCGPAERDEAKKIAGLANHPNVHSLAEQTLSIGLTKAVIRRLSTLITTDSGPRHFATAFKVPAVTLFGPTNIQWTETYSELDRNLQLNLPCGPCQKRVCPLGHHQCMTQLLPDKVYNAMPELYDGRKVRHAG